ncbi:MAG TPA: chromosomal replication initiator protein DnaA [Nitrospiraceae bacterium]|nr:MAG: chromosomal replication initiation protein DnaA [Nitrospirae bacterium GWA2_46_11]OGW23825.1 MAG: chromosomal replication initiation protein DnaA [Nitrospirae bacterium GWB2_47_37]HAK88488.1 chromosomal replication initiator protein DnaA [Nitrospiraceae bacterium]HCZ11362.1 chromosomal replication initiator protein DnaA [Nitrospiraceae bacterium]
MAAGLSAEEIWQKSLSKIAEKVGESTFDLWFKPMKLTQLKDKAATLEIPNRFFRDWIEDYYPTIISEIMEGLLGYTVNIKYKIAEKEDAALKKLDSKLETRRTKLASRGIYLNPKYTFNTFVVGPSNQFVHAAAIRVGENPGFAYNPLFIYGGVGLGKTHIINAIGNAIVDQHPGRIVHYVSAEQFTNEVIAAIRHEKMGEFKEKYRNVDALLVDDIQFIAGKTTTQEEFFHTFNSLYEKQRQIVISSDRSPLEIADITDRLRSRFSMGLIADIQPPEVETKVAIIRKKVDMEKMVISDDVAYFIATKVKSNIRELEGCLIKLGAHASITGMPIDINMARNVLKDLISDEEKPITVDIIQKAVGEYFGMKAQELKTKKRTKEVANARQIAMYITKQLTQLSLSEIGRSFGGKDHATVIYACKQIEDKRGRDETIKKTVEYISKKIKS